MERVHTRGAETTTLTLPEGTLEPLRHDIRASA
jgi:hypothetical protein